MEYWISSKEVGAIYPGIFSHPLRCGSVFIGREQCSTPFLFNPFELYLSGMLNNPNIIVFGQIGFGKSAFVKALLSRHLQHGFCACVMDPKGEYQALARMSGGSTFSFGNGPGAGLNPLSCVPGSWPASRAHADRLDNLVLTFGAALQRELSPLESFVLDEALIEAERACGELDMFDIYEMLMNMRHREYEGFGGFGLEASNSAGQLALELRRYLFGDLVGIVDGRKTASGCSFLVNKFMHVDLFRAFRPEAMRVGLPIFMSMLSKQLTNSSRRYLIALDEAWLALASPGCIGFFRSYWKLARGYGISNIAVVHRTEDLFASGEAGSVSEKVASGLVSDSQTFVVFRLDPSSARRLGALLKLSEREVSLVSTLARGQSFWKVSERSYLVDIMLSPAERSMFDTDKNMNS